MLIVHSSIKLCVLIFNIGWLYFIIRILSNNFSKIKLTIQSRKAIVNLIYTLDNFRFLRTTFELPPSPVERHKTKIIYQLRSEKTQSPFHDEHEPEDPQKLNELFLLVRCTHNKVTAKHLLIDFWSLWTPEADEQILT